MAPDETNNEAFTVRHIICTSHVLCLAKISLAHPPSPLWSNRKEEEDNDFLERILSEMANIGPVCAVQSLTSAHVSILLVTAVDVLLLCYPPRARSVYMARHLYEPYGTGT